MAKITFRVNDSEKAEIEARAARAGMDASTFIRRALNLERDAPDLTARIEDHEQRLARLEQVAGL